VQRGNEERTTERLRDMAGSCISVIGLSLLGVLTLATAGPAEEPAHTGKVIWEEDFGDPALHGWNARFVNNQTAVGNNPGEIKLEAEDGILSFTAKRTFHAIERGDHAEARFIFGYQQQREKVLVSEAPILEIRVRQLGRYPHTCLYYGVKYETYEGKAGYSSAKMHLEKGQWRDFEIDLYQDPQLMGSKAGKYIREIQFELVGTGETGTVQFKHIRLRQKSASEIGKEKRFDASDFQMKPCPRMERFFAVGLWGLHPPRFAGGLDEGRLEITLDHSARNWTNLLMGVYPCFISNVWKDFDRTVPGAEIEITPARDKNRRDEETRAEYWIRVHKYYSNLLKRYGIHMIPSIEWFAGDPHKVSMKPITDLDLNRLNRWADMVTSAFKDDDVVLGWYSGDEIGALFLRKYLLTKKLFETRDPTRAALNMVNVRGSVSTIELYAPWQQVIFAENYPVVRPSIDDPWRVLDRLREINNITDAPTWVWLQAHGELQGQAGSRSSPEETRLMSWLALAGGAKGFIYFLYNPGLMGKDRCSIWYDFFITGRARRAGESLKGMVDSYGNATPWWEEYKDFARQVAPLGELLLKARVAENTGIEADATPLKLGDRVRPAVYIGVLAVNDAYILIPVNQDRNGPRQLTIKVPERLTKNRSLYDLVELGRISLSGNVFNCGTLRAGEGRPYILCGEQQYQEAKDTIMKARAQQAIRVAGLDVMKAERWKLEVEGYLDALESATEMAREDRYEEAFKKAELASTEVNAELAADENYSVAERILSECSRDLGVIEEALNELTRRIVADHLKEGKPMRELKPEQEAENCARKLSGISEDFSELKEDFFYARADKLVREAEKLKRRIDRIMPEVEEVSGHILPFESFPEKPWKVTGFIYESNGRKERCVAVKSGRLVL